MKCPMKFHKKDIPLFGYFKCKWHLNLALTYHKISTDRETGRVRQRWGKAGAFTL